MMLLPGLALRSPAATQATAVAPAVAAETPTANAQPAATRIGSRRPTDSAASPATDGAQAMPFASTLLALALGNGVAGRLAIGTEASAMPAPTTDGDGEAATDDTPHAGLPAAITPEASFALAPPPAAVPLPPAAANDEHSDGTAATDDTAAASAPAVLPTLADALALAGAIPAPTPVVAQAAAASRNEPAIARTGRTGEAARASAQALGQVAATPVDLRPAPATDAAPTAPSFTATAGAATHLATAAESDSARGPAAIDPAGAESGTTGLATTNGLAASTATAGNDPTVTTVKLPVNAPAHEQRQALAEALGERLQVQITQRSEHAVIRLEPPRMGQIDIAVRHEAGALQVHISASHGEVQRQLTQIGDSLKQELSQRHAGDVSVQVAGQSPREGDARQRQRQAQPDADTSPGRALAEADGGSVSTPFTLSLDRS